jgi:hypothetical protein
VRHDGHVPSKGMQGDEIKGKSYSRRGLYVQSVAGERVLKPEQLLKGVLASLANSALLFCG